MGGRFLAALLLAALAACHHGPPPWRPYKAEYLYLRPTARMAALIYEGDIETLLKANARFIGELRAKADTQAQVRAARVGGTHVYLVKAESETFVIGSSCSATSYGSTTTGACSNVTRTVARNYYAILQLERPAWDSLPELLRPVALDAPECVPLPTLPKGCMYTHYYGFMKHDPARVFTNCQGSEYIDVTDKLPRNACKLPER